MDVDLSMVVLNLDQIYGQLPYNKRTDRMVARALKTLQRAGYTRTDITSITVLDDHLISIRKDSGAWESLTDNEW